MQVLNLKGLGVGRQAGGGKAVEVRDVSLYQHRQQEDTELSISPAGHSHGRNEAQGSHEGG